MVFHEIEYRGRKSEITKLLRERQDIKRRIRYHQQKIGHHQQKIEEINVLKLVAVEEKLSKLIKPEEKE